MILRQLTKLMLISTIVFQYRQSLLQPRYPPYEQHQEWKAEQLKQIIVGEAERLNQELNERVSSVPGNLSSELARLMQKELREIQSEYESSTRQISNSLERQLEKINLKRDENRRQYKKICEENTRLLREEEQHREEKQRKDWDIETLEKEKGILEKKLAQQEKENRRKDGIVEALEREKELLEKRVEEQKQENRKRDEKIETLEKEKGLIERKVEQFKKRTTEQQQLSRNLSAETSKQEKEITSLKQKLELAVEFGLRQDRENKEEISSLKQANEDHLQNLKRLTTLKDELIRNNKDLEGQIKHKRARSMVKKEYEEQSYTAALSQLLNDRISRRGLSSQMLRGEESQAAGS